MDVQFPRGKFPGNVRTFPRGALLPSQRQRHTWGGRGVQRRCGWSGGVKAGAKVKGPKEESEQDQHADEEKDGEMESKERGEDNGEESDWQEILDQTGQLYLYNRKTGQSQWERP